MAKGLLTDEEELRRFNAIEAQAQPWYKVGLPMEGRSLLFPFQDSMPGSVFNERSAAIPGLLAGALNYLTAPERARTGSDPSFNPEKEAVDMAMNTFGGGIVTGKALRNSTGQGGIDLALNAWHGTPHNIQGKFDINKVGTGEGAQAYGHGIYFGEARGTGEQYRDALGFVGAKDKVGEIYGKEGISFFFENALEKSGVPSGAAKSQAKLWADKFVEGEAINNQIANQVIESKGLQPHQVGNLYRVDIPDEQIPKMLDWDKPVSKDLLAKITPENLGLQVKKFDDGLGYVTNDGVLVTRVKQGKAKEVTEEMLKNSFNDSLKRYSTSGQNLYGSLVPGNPKVTSEILSNAGITGMRYLDEGSRAKGQGTSNFVSFKPETIKILEKNGIPIEKLLEEGLLGN